LAAGVRQYLGDAAARWHTSVKVATTLKPNTKYRFECVRPLDDITTDDEGVAR
jgi:hypothetical protein